MNNILRKPFRYSYNGAVFWIIGINVLVFVLMMLIGDRIITTLEIDSTKIGIPERRVSQTLPVSFEGKIYLTRGGYLVEKLSALGMSPIVVLHGWVWTFVTYMFMHGGVTHILFNMLGLYIFGTHVEKQMGTKEFIMYYFVTGVLAGVFAFVAHFFMAQSNSINYYVPLVGASGAIYAVMLACAIFFPDSIVYIWGIIPMRMPVMVIVYTGLAIFLQISGRGGNVSHLTHLAGFLFGWIYFLVRYGINPWNRLFGRR